MYDTIDFQRLFNLSPNLYMLLDKGLRYVTANEAYLRATASRLEDLVGRHVLAAFPNDPQDPGNVPARLLRESFERVLSRRAPDTLALIPYRVPQQTPEGVVMQDRYWSATHTPVLDERGEVAFILQHTVDVTELQALKRSARTSEFGADGASSPTQLEAGVLHRARHVQEANLRLDEQQRRLRQLFDQAPGIVAVLRGRDMVFEMTNPAYDALIGHRSVLGKPLREALPETVAQGFPGLVEQVLRTGVPFVGRSGRAPVRRVPRLRLPAHHRDGRVHLGRLRAGAGRHRAEARRG